MVICASCRGRTVRVNHNEPSATLSCLSDQIPCVYRCGDHIDTPAHDHFSFGNQLGVNLHRSKRRSDRQRLAATDPTFELTCSEVIKQTKHGTKR